MSDYRDDDAWEEHQDELGERLKAELVYQGFDLNEIAVAPIIDCTTTCPECGHGEAMIVCPADPTGFIETCLNCDHTFVDVTP